MELNVTQINYYFGENNHPASAKVSFAGKQGDNSINAAIYVGQSDVDNELSKGVEIEKLKELAGGDSSVEAN